MVVGEWGVAWRGRGGRKEGGRVEGGGRGGDRGIKEGWYRAESERVGGRDMGKGE